MISERIREILDLLKSNIDIPVYSDGVLERFDVPAVYVAYREDGFAEDLESNNLIDVANYSVKVYSKESSEAIEIAENIKDILVRNSYKFVSGVRLKDDKYFVFVLEFKRLWW